ncbi:MAG TPA: hypothetical protein VEH29_03590 [Acidimicrobiales bacterium]|nr:hypothetical protein [Acidimicrobiales bacterium]
MDPLTISCDECRLEGSSACDDCVVSFLLADDLEAESATGPACRSASGAVIVDAAEARAMRLLHSAGLVPTLRFERRVG